MSTPEWLDICQKHLHNIAEQVELDQIVWTSLVTPKAEAMRAFQGETPDYLLNVCQANIEGEGVMTEGMAIVRKEGVIIHLPKECAADLFNKASAKFN